MIWYSQSLGSVKFFKFYLLTLYNMNAGIHFTQSWKIHFYKWTCKIMMQDDFKMQLFP